MIGTSSVGKISFNTDPTLKLRLNRKIARGRRDVSQRRNHCSRIQSATSVCLRVNTRRQLITLEGMKGASMIRRQITHLLALAVLGLGTSVWAQSGNTSDSNSDIRQDRKDLRQDKRDLRSDRKDVRSDKRDLRQILAVL